jgi:hypothetical protein
MPDCKICGEKLDTSTNYGMCPTCYDKQYECPQCKTENLTFIVPFLERSPQLTKRHKGYWYCYHCGYETRDELLVLMTLV